MTEERDPLEEFRAQVNGTNCHTCTEYGWGTCEHCKGDRAAIAAWEKERATFLAMTPETDKSIATQVLIEMRELSALRAALEKIEGEMRADAEVLLGTGRDLDGRNLIAYADDLRYIRTGEDVSEEYNGPPHPDAEPKKVAPIENSHAKLAAEMRTYDDGRYSVPIGEVVQWAARVEALGQDALLKSGTYPVVGRVEEKKAARLTADELNAVKLAIGAIAAAAMAAHNRGEEDSETAWNETADVLLALVEAEKEKDT